MDYYDIDMKNGGNDMRKILSVLTLIASVSMLCSCGTDIAMPEDEDGSVIYVSPADQAETEEEVTTEGAKADVKFFVSIN